MDYAGQTVAITDRHSGESRAAAIFVAVLGASSYTYAEATWSQELPEWIGSHVRCFDFLGAVPEIVVPDFVAGNKIRVMWPPPLCGRLQLMPREVSGRIASVRQHNLLQRMQPIEDGSCRSSRLHRCARR